MIRVNLLTNIGAAQAAGAPEVSGEMIAPETLRLAVTKILVVIALPLVVIILQRVAISDVENNLRTVQTKMKAVNQEIAKFGDAGPKIEMYNREKARVDKELEVVRNLAHARLREVKALHAIQTLMPNNTWADKIIINGNSIRLLGYTAATDGITDLIKALENNVFFSKIEPKFTGEEKLGDRQVKKFELEFKTGK